MVKSNDGFYISELDLKLRGYGDFFGTRQHGLPDFKIANLYKDHDILKEAQEIVFNLELNGLDAEESQRLEQEVSDYLKKFQL